MGSAADAPIPLWPGGAPEDEQGKIEAERDLTKPSDGQVGGKALIRLGNVSVPSITVFMPAEGRANGGAVVVCPGGGYSILAMDLEGSEICDWLNGIGYTAVLLKYRVPGRPGDGAHRLPLQDAQRAIGLVRLHAAEWSIDPKRIGILGFSAGGHLAASASTRFQERVYTPIDEADRQSCRPDFSLLIYPAYLASKEGDCKLAPDIHVASDTPPAFIVQTEDDGVGVGNSLAYYFAMTHAHAPAEMHLYPTGGHGYGLRESKEPVSQWPKLAAEWLARTAK